MNRIELKQKARENVRKDKFAIILITLIATALMGAAASFDFSLPGSALYHEFLTVTPTATVETTQTAKSSEEFDLDDFFDDDGEFDLDHYYGYDGQDSGGTFQNPFANDYGYGYGNYDSYYYDDFAEDFSVVNAGLMLVVFLLGGALMAGLLSYHLKIWRGEDGEIRDLFSKFNKDFPRITKMYLLQTLYVFLWSLLLIVPGIIMSIAYSQAYYLMLDDPDLSATDALKLSKELMKGRKWEYFVMLLSFIGWFLLGILTLGILFLWIDPYVYQTLAGYYDTVVKPARAELAAAKAAEAAAAADATTGATPNVAPEETVTDDGVAFTDVETPVENKNPGETESRLRPGE